LPVSFEPEKSAVPPSAAVPAPRPPDASVTPPNEGSPPPSAMRTWGWIALAAGAALGGISIGLAVKTLDERNSLCPSLCSGNDAQTTVQNWRAAYYVTLGTAIAAAGVGVALFVFAPSTGDRTRTSTVIELRPGGLSWRVSF
jgi:hypothetical protein